MQGRRILIISAIGLSALLAVMLTWVLIGTILTESVDPVALSGLVISLIALILTVVPLLRATGPGSSPTTSTLAEQLASVLLDDANEEAIARQLRDPHTLKVAWAETQRDVIAANLTVRLRLSGEIGHDLDHAAADVYDSYSQIVSGRLVILGEPGAGKSVLALILTLGLLAERKRRGTGPVAVLLSASSWDPTRQSLDDWIVAHLGSAHYNGDQRTPRLLVDQQQIVPVIDGLDEIPEEDRRVAIKEINSSIRTTRPVIVTCRAVEYQDLIRAGAPMLRRAPVIEVLPTEAREAVNYLNGIDWPEGVSWTSVFSALQRNEESPVELALSTPLMISIARTVYERLGGNPSELLNSTRFDSRHSVEEFLTGRLIDAAYKVQDEDVKPTWSVHEAKAYLTYLAKYLHRYREREIQWWLMADRILSTWTAPALGVTAGALIMIAVALWVSFSGLASLDAIVIYSACSGAGAAVLVMLVWLAITGPKPGQLVFRRSGSLERLRKGFRVGLSAALFPLAPTLAVTVIVLTLTDNWSALAASDVAISLGAAIAGALTIGVSVGIHQWLNAPPERAGRASPGESMRQDRISSYVSAIVGGLSAALVLLPLTALVMITMSSALGVMSRWIGWPGHESIESVAMARWADLGMFFGSDGLMVGGGVIFPGLILSVLLLLTHAWPRFRLLEYWSKMRGVLPRDLPKFLADARERNLLRQSAASYQFRHARLQEYLVRTSSSSTTTTSDSVRRTIVRSFQRHRRLVDICLVVGAIALTALLVPKNTAQVTLAGLYGASSYSWAESPTGPVMATFSPDDPEIHIWNMATGSYLNDIPVPAKGEFSIRQIDFSPDGRAIRVESYENKTAAGKGIQGVSILDVESGKFLIDDASEAEFAAGGADVLAVPQKGSSTDSSAIELWDMGLLKLRTKFSGDLVSPVNDSDTPEQVGPQPSWPVNNDTFMITRPTGVNSLIDARSGTTIKDFVASGTLGAHPQYSPDDRLIISFDSLGATLWDARDGKYISAISELSQSSAIQFSQDDRYMLATFAEDPSRLVDSTLRVWDIQTSHVMATVSSQVGFEAASFNADGRTFSALIPTSPVGRGGEVRLWATSTGAQLMSTRTLTVYGRPNSNLPESPKSYSSATEARASDEIGEDETANAFTRQLLVTNDSPTESVFYDADTGKQLAKVPILVGFSEGESTTFGANYYEISATGLLAYELEDGIHIFRIRSNQEVRVVKYDEIGPTNISFLFSPDGSILAVWTRDHVTLLGSNGEYLGIIDDVPFQTATSAYSVISYSPDSRTFAIATGALDDKTDIWDLKTLRMTYRLIGHNGRIESRRYIDNNTIVTTGEDDTVRIWSLSK